MFSFFLLFEFFMRKRTFARELALQSLYQLDIRGSEAIDDIELFLKENSKDNDVVSFAKELIYGAWEHRAYIDKLIKESAQNWELNRMAVVDRNILRIATYELMFRNDIPPIVAINEAIDIAKKYSTKNSGPFINGVLDNIRLKRKEQIVNKAPIGDTSSK